MPFDMAYLRAIWSTEQQTARTQRYFLQRMVFLDKGNRMQDAADVHMWCVTTDGTVKDEFRMDPERALVWGRDEWEPPLKIVRRAWGTVPPVHRDMLQSEKARYLGYAFRYSKGHGTPVKRVLRECLEELVCNQDKFPDKCISIAVLQSLLYGWTVKVGSLGWECVLPEVDIWWEYGNGGAECPREFCYGA